MVYRVIYGAVNMNIKTFERRALYRTLMVIGDKNRVKRFMTYEGT